MRCKDASHLEDGEAHTLAAPSLIPPRFDVHNADIDATEQRELARHQQRKPRHQLLYGVVQPSPKAPQLR